MLLLSGVVWFRVVCLVCVACVMWSVSLWKVTVAVEANDWRNREHVARPVLKLENGKDPRVSLVYLRGT